MKNEKIKKLEKAGYKVGGIKEFLNLTDEEVSLIEMKRTLITKLREARKKQKLSQAKLAKKLKTSQSRVAKVEAADSAVSLDLICRSLFALGIKQKEIGKVLFEN